MSLEERIEEQRHKLRDNGLEIEEADVPKVPADVNTPSLEEHNGHFETKPRNETPHTSSTQVIERTNMYQ